jgi:hypothetical protein
MHSYHTHSPSFRLTDPLRSPRCLEKRTDAVQFGVLTEMFTCLFNLWPPVRQVLVGQQRGANHPTRLTQHAWQQIKCLTLWRFTFYVVDSPPQRLMRSIKELLKV